MDTYQLRPPPPDQEQALERTLPLCRHVYNAARASRTTWWERGQGKRATYYQQQAELPELKAASPASRAVHAPVVQDGILRLDRPFPACRPPGRGGRDAG